VPAATSARYVTSESDAAPTMGAKVSSSVRARSTGDGDEEEEEGVEVDVEVAAEDEDAGGLVRSTEKLMNRVTYAMSTLRLEESDAHTDVRLRIYQKYFKISKFKLSF
jgi:uncharacterized protein YggE